jgi:hypothetical protein
MVGVMAEKSLFLGGRLVNQSIVSASSEVAGLPATNLQEYMPEKKWRATTKTASIYIQMPKFVACDACAIISHNCSTTATFKVTAGTTLAIASGGSPAFDSGYLEMWPTGVKPSDEEWPHFSTLGRWSNGTPYPVWVIRIEDPLNSDNLEVGRVMIDRAFRPTFSIGHNYGVSLILADVQHRTPFNRLYTDRRGPPGRSMALPLSMVTKRDLWDNLFTMSRLYGTYDDFFVCLDPGETVDRHKIMMQAMFADKLDFESQPVFDNSGNVWRTALTLVELV